MFLFPSSKEKMGRGKNFPLSSLKSSFDYAADVDVVYGDQ